MGSSKSLLVLVLALAISSVSALHLDKGNAEAKAAFNAALLELWSDGTYNQLHVDSFGKTPERFADCVENPAAWSYPSISTNQGLLQQILTSSTVKLGYFLPLATPPSFELVNGIMVGGFYPNLAEAIVGRISAHYGLATPISIQWVAITQVQTGFYDDHYAGVFDVIFMSLFKTSMWSFPVAPRNVLWDFSCGLLTTEPLRYYVCPSAVSKGLDTSSPGGLTSANTIVSFIAGGAQEAAAQTNFAGSQMVASADLSVLYDACENGGADVVVELPNRIGSALDGIAVTSGPLGPYNNSGAAFRWDRDPCGNEQ